MEIYPIWKTIEVDLTSKLSAGAVNYSVYVNDALAYEGRAYADINGKCKVALNDIIRGHLGTTNIPDITEQLWDADNALVEVYVEANDTGPTFLVLNDWSYERSLEWDDQVAMSLNDRVINKAYTAVPFPVSLINMTEAVLKKGSTVEGRFATDTHSATLFISLTEAGHYTLEARSGYGMEVYAFDAVDACHKGYLLYRNALGGFDMLPLDSIVENDAYKRESYEVTGNNADSAKHLRRDYLNALSKTYTLRTPVLTDDEASRMHNVLGTVQAWLITPERGQEAVNMKANGWKRKTFKNEGRKRVVYEFDVEVAQPMERR